MIKEFDYLYKSVIVGNSGVGKSSILIRFAENQFQQHYLATIGVDFRFKTINVENKLIKFQIWDTAGQERFRTITSAYYRGSQAILLVYDLTDKQSFNDIENFWLTEVDKYGEKDALLILVGNKSDLGQSKSVTPEQIKTLCKKKNMKYYECSAKVGGDDILAIFTEIGKGLMEKQQNLTNLQWHPNHKGKQLDQQSKKKKSSQSCC